MKVKDNTDNNGIYIELDTILDTRFTVANTINPKEFKKYYLTGQYQTRVKDVFGKITNDIFMARYRVRDKLILVNSEPTRIMHLIKSYIIEQTGIIRNRGGLTGVSVILNTYPYELTDSEQKMFSNILSKEVLRVPVKFVHMKPIEVTPMWVYDNICGMFMYSGLEWLELHSSTRAIMKRPLLDVNLFIPTIVIGNMLSKDVTNNTFRELMVNAGSLITLSAINTKYFSRYKDKGIK